MGGGSSSSSSSSSSIVETDNSNIQQNDNQVALNLEDVSDSTITLTDQGAVEEAFAFGGDALDQAFNFGAQSLNNSQEFGRDVLGEAQEISRDALQMAGNAQTNAFSKIRDIAESFTQGTSSNTTTILIAIGGSVAVLGLLFFFRRK